MDAPINIQPPGLLSLLGIKTGGRNPINLETMVSPSIDLLHWYLMANSIELRLDATALVAQAASGGIGITATSPVNLSDGTNLTVPQNEWWYVEVFSVRGDLSGTVGNSADAQPGYIPPSTDVFVMLPTSDGGVHTVAAAITTSWSRACNEPVWIPPGSVIAFYLHQFVRPAAGSLTLYGHMRLTRLLI